MNDIKFTIIIPTRERSYTLLYCIKTILNQDYENFEIIVSDNFSQDNTKEVVESFKDPRIRYINTGRRVSMSSNWEFALNHVKGDWVTFIGDDDGLIPEALKTVYNVIKKTNTYAITSLRNTYGWNNSPSETGRLIVFLTKGYEWRNSREWIKKWICDDDAITSDLPNVYTGGFVNMEIINFIKLQSNDNKFFHSACPDIYSGFAISSVLDKYIFLREPVSISGVSKSSNSSSQECKPDSELSKFILENDMIFHESIHDGSDTLSIPMHLYDCYLKTTFLHNDFLKIRLEDRLVFSISKLPQDKYNEMIGYFINISAKNGLDFEKIEQESENLKKKILIPKIRKIYDYLFSRRTIICPEYGVNDVYDASLLSKSIYLSETKYKHWKISIIFKVFKTIFDYKSLKNIATIIHKST